MNHNYQMTESGAGCLPTTALSVSGHGSERTSLSANVRLPRQLAVPALIQQYLVKAIIVGYGGNVNLGLKYFYMELMPSLCYTWCMKIRKKGWDCIYEF